MSALAKHASLVQLRRLLRKLDHAHTSDESSCPACRLQRLALQLNEEVEGEVQQLAVPGLGPGSASVAMAVESVLTVLYALDVRGAEEQGRVTQALLDYIGDVVRMTRPMPQVSRRMTPIRPTCRLRRGAAALCTEALAAPPRAGCFHGSCP